MMRLFLLTTAFGLVSTIAIAEEYDPKGEPKSVLTDDKGRLTDEQLFERAKDECSAGRQIDWPKLTAEGWAEVRECITKAKEQRILKDPQVAEICGIHSKGMALTECAHNVYRNKNVEKWKLAKAQHDYIELLKRRLAEGEKAGKPTKSHNELREKLKRALAEHERQVNTNTGSGSASSGSAGSRSAGSGSGGSGSTGPGSTGSGGGRDTRNAHGYDPKYRNQSDITGTPNAHGGNVSGGGVAPTNKISRPAFLGNGYTGGNSVRSNGQAITPTAPRGGVGGVRVDGRPEQSNAPTTSVVKCLKSDGTEEPCAARKDAVVTDVTPKPAPAPTPTPTPKVKVEGLKAGEQVQ